MNAHALSALLRKSFNIYPRSQRRGKQKLRGYQKADFADAWERYLPDQNLENSKGNTEAEESIRQESAVSDVDSGPPDHVQFLNYQVTQPVPAGRGLPNPRKSQRVSMSQFKARWEKGRSILKQFAGKAAGLFTATRT
jgi:hypothetical protein